MKVKSVEANNRKKAIEIETPNGRFAHRHLGSFPLVRGTRPALAGNVLEWADTLDFIDSFS